jgi:hypothetical protein
MLHDELRELLRELCAATGAAAAAIVPTEGEPAPRAAVTIRTAVGAGSALVAWFDHPEDPPDPNGRAAALERTARALRSCGRRWDADELPELSYPELGRTSPARAHARTLAYLGALVRSLGMKAAVVTRKAKIVASAGDLDELDRERVPFTVRRVQVEVDRQEGKSSHAELVGEDFFAVSFWYDACLVCFFSGPFALDFVRHRARQVTRELSHLLAMLDDPDLDPIQLAPRPES